MNQLAQRRRPVLNSNHGHMMETRRALRPVSSASASVLCRISYSEEVHPPGAIRNHLVLKSAVEMFSRQANLRNNRMSE